MNKKASGHDVPSTLSRRTLLAPLAFAPLWRETAFPASAAGQAPGGEIRESGFLPLRSLITPNEQFFVRNHFTAPKLSQAAKLRVAGRVRSPFEISYAELAGQAARTLTATIECAGDAVGGVSTATWEGVPLVTLLQRAGLYAGIKHIRLVGADRGIEESNAATPIPFARSIPLEKALHPDTIVALRMNGLAIPLEHGYPWRAIVPGWYGMASVKWLAGIEALEHDDMSYFMTQRYVAVRLETVGSDRRPVTRMRVKSLVVEPQEGGVVAAGLVTIRGAAWAGENRITQVEVSTDEGKSWVLATLDKDVRPYAWVLWSYPWEARTPGAYVILARATDDHGNVQPPVRDKLRVDNYERNCYHSVRCEVR